MIETYFEIGYTVITVLLLSFFIAVSLKNKLTRWSEIKWWVFFGIIFNLISFSWLYTVYPLIWLPEGLTQILGIGLLQLILSVSSGLTFAVVGYAFFYVRNISNHKRPLVIAASFTITEMIRSLVISLLYYGEGTTIDLHFNAGTIGNALSTTPLVELAYYGGTFALTFFLTYLAYSLLSLSLKEALVHFLLVLGIFLITHFFIPINTPAKDIVIGVVTSNVATADGEGLKKNRAESNESIARLIADDKGKKDIIVLPEDARFLSTLSKVQKERLIEKNMGSLIVDGETIVRNGNLATISLFYETATEKITGKGKELLLPFNEYIPYFFNTIFYFFVGDELDAYKAKHTYAPLQSGKIITFEGARVSTLICSEILSYRMIESVGDENPGIVFFQSRLNVFNNNPLFLMHLRSFSKIAAAQMRTSIISSNNYAPSYMISARGKIVGTIPLSMSYNEVVLSKRGEVILKR